MVGHVLEVGQQSGELPVEAPRPPLREQIFAELAHGLQADTDRLFRVLLVGHWLFALGVAIVIAPTALPFPVKAAVVCGSLLGAWPLAVVWLRVGRVGARHASAVVRATEATEQRISERTLELEATIARYRALLENTAAIPFELDLATLKVLYVAPRVTELLDCKLRHIENRDTLFRSFPHPGDAPRVREAVIAFARGAWSPGDPIDYRMISKAGRIIHVRTLLSSRDGGRIRGIMLDVTRQHQLELELQQSQKLESVGRLAAGVAHEINTPIQFVSDSVQFVSESMTDLVDIVHKHQAAVASILGGAPSDDRAREAIAAAEAADLPYLTEELPKALARAGEGLERVAAIVRSMKVFAHHSDKMTYVDLNTAVRSTLTIARNEYKYVADIDVEYGELPRVMCQGGEINQVILNVLLNATHAIGDLARAGDRGMITVRTRTEADHVVVSIADTGGGIPDDVRERIFDPFFTTKQVGKGTGQGLTIARSVIVDKHRGSLTFESELGAGTTFYIRIPIEPPGQLHAGSAA